MKTSKNSKRILIVFLVMISVTSFYYAYKKFKINRPISAKLVLNDFNLNDNLYKEL
ncbi:hypothetical protein R9X47_26335 [Wukongibacter baidiensis]|uniref:hypothetical protein n=1 Tax=Wukongibacter baidiensis TaxID=1723361 RepID=UPI003D7F5D40